MSEWLTVLDRYGWPSFFLLIMGMFFWRGLWPILVTTMKTERERNEALTKEFLLALERRDKESATAHNAIITELRRMADTCQRK